MADMFTGSDRSRRRRVHSSVTPDSADRSSDLEQPSRRQRVESGRLFIVPCDSIRGSDGKGKSEATGSRLRLPECPAQNLQGQALYFSGVWERGRCVKPASRPRSQNRRSPVRAGPHGATRGPRLHRWCAAGQGRRSQSPSRSRLPRYARRGWPAAAGWRSACG